MTYRTFNTINGETIYLNGTTIGYIKENVEIDEMNEIAGMVYLSNGDRYFVDKYQLAYILSREFTKQKIKVAHKPKQPTTS